MEMPPSKCPKCGKKLTSKVVYHGHSYECECGYHTYIFSPNMYREPWEPVVYGASR